ncbi:MAG TPA: MaoC/PaaZ C-terminal domain-containing protein [Crenalkalicoccus sp.]|nr:MaoC/PaaZ C-terminal domain-containing protein [Crenalkalicoccus sp.]
MPIHHESLTRLDFPEKEFAYDERDTMLYALAVGMGRQMPGDLRFVFEQDLLALPTLATVIAWDDTWQDRTGIDISKVVHGEMRVTTHRPLAPAGRVAAKLRITDVFDKGPGRGAVLLAETRLRDAATGEAVATLLSTVFARGDGGFGGPLGRGPEPHALPRRAPDGVVESQTRPEQALLYRLCGDRNPLHADPGFARRAGFERPILHGLCSYGIAAAGVVKAVCPDAPHRLTHVEARFTAPVFPGETLVTELWLDPHGASFRTTVAQRGVVALDHGRALISQD